MFSTKTKITELIYAIIITIILIIGGILNKSITDILPIAIVIVIIGWIHVYILRKNERNK